jgi:hypothetical protein
VVYLFAEDIHEPGPRAGEAAFAACRRYLRSIVDRLPPGVRAFASADWHYDPADHRCPHDAWIEALTVHETPADGRSQRRNLEIYLRCLGAYHDGHLELRYTGVRSYSLTVPHAGPRPGIIGHGDWLTDEVRLSDGGAVLHEVRFERGRLLIECDDLGVTWHPAAGGMEQVAPRRT